MTKHPNKAKAQPTTELTTLRQNRGETPAAASAQEQSLAAEREQRSSLM
ncbi:MAG: hypothetical protein L6R45_07475 [Anaerolineae bacterium]|nr:hypothetical protein [Anaerolineae bacterium]